MTAWTLLGVGDTDAVADAAAALLSAVTHDLHAGARGVVTVQIAGHGSGHLVAVATIGERGLAHTAAAWVGVKAFAKTAAAHLNPQKRRHHANWEAPT